MGGITEIATSAPGLQLGPARTPRAARRDAQAQRLLDRAVRQVPRGAGVGDQPDGAVRQLADRQRRLRVLLRLHRRRDQPVLPRHLRGHDPRRARQDARGGLPLHRGHDRQGDRLGPPAEGAHAATSRSSCTSRPARPTRRTTSPKEWADKYKGEFDDGWDALREETFARQKELGVIPPDAELTARPDEIPAWDDMPDDLKPVLARQMEVYAGFLEHTDHHVGRLVDALDGPRGPRRHARLLHHRRQRRLAPRARCNGTFNEMINAQRRRRRSRRPSS